MNDQKIYKLRVYHKLINTHENIINSSGIKFIKSSKINIKKNKTKGKKQKKNEGIPFFHLALAEHLNIGTKGKTLCSIEMLFGF